MNEQLSMIQKHIISSHKAISFLMSQSSSKDKTNAFLEAAMLQIEVACIEMRKLTEEISPDPPPLHIGQAVSMAERIYGKLEITDNNWLHITLNTLLPTCKSFKSSQYVADSITRLMNDFAKSGGELPMFEKAFIAIIERCNFQKSKSFDHDNKGYKAIPNALKGRVFQDDNQFQLSLGLFAELSDEASCHIFVLPESETGDFFNLKQDNLLN